MGIEKLNFQVIRRTIATEAQSLGSVKDIQWRLRHSRADTTAKRVHAGVAESVQQMVSTEFVLLTSERAQKWLTEHLLPNAANHLLAVALSCGFNWWAQQDSNLRLPPREGVPRVAGRTF